MHIVIVEMQVKPDQENEFLTITQRNVRETLREPGVRRFDLLHEAGGSARFLLIEVYERANDHAHHKETAHYKRWAEEVGAVLAAPRSRTIYESCFPHESGWD